MTTLTIKPRLDNTPVSSYLNSCLANVGKGLKYSELFFSKGTYIIDKPLYCNSGSDTSPTKIRAEKGAILKLISRASSSTFKTMIPIFGQKRGSISNIVFDGLCFDGNAKNQTVSTGKGFHNFIGLGTCKNVVIKNIEVTDTKGDGVRLTNANNISFSASRIKQCGHDGFYVDCGTNIEAYDNYIELRTNSALRLRHVINGHLHDNFIVNRVGSGASSPGMQIENSITGKISKTILIEKNVIKDTFGPGIWVIGTKNSSPAVASDLKIKNNSFINCGIMDRNHGLPGVGGIVCDGWTNVEISDNSIDKCRGYGIAFGSYIAIPSSGKNYAAKVYRNHITNTKPANYPGTSSGSAIANLIPAKYLEIDVMENILSGNTFTYYNVKEKANPN